MSREGQFLDKKSLRLVQGKMVNWSELAKDCVAFANATGGHLLIGIEDDQDEPSAGQRVPMELPDILRCKLAERTVNVSVLPDVVTVPNGGQYIDLLIPRSISVASTTDGRYFLRVADQNRPVVGDEVLRLTNERAALPWETQTTLRVPRDEADPVLCERLIAALRASDRVKPSIKEKTTNETMDHYQLAHGPYLTHLGILCLGRQRHRAQLISAPMIQFIKFDALGEKVNKLVWDDHTQNPMALIDSVWREIPDFRESHELPDGLYRQRVPAFDEVVVRELMVNALVHRPYTQRGDIFLNLHPDRLEIVNPGPLPLGVTPRNILHATVRRNEHLARLFHDLKLMEREGSGFDKIYEVLLSQGRPVPEVTETFDRVQVTVRRRILRPEIVDFIAKADQTYQLTQRERIALGLLAQRDALTARELATALELPSAEALQPWLVRLLGWSIVHNAGRTQATRYFVAPELLRGLHFPAGTTLKRIEPHRLAALILEDLRRYPRSSTSEVHQRIGMEIHPKQVKRALDALVTKNEVRFGGDNRWRRYWATS
jgi:ATP-dependent DNA helicase RecG